MTKKEKLKGSNLEGTSLLDKNLNVIFNSSSFNTISGFDIVSEENINLRNIIHPEDRDEIISLLQELILTPGKSKTCNFRAVHANGNYIWLKCIYTNRLHEREVDAIVCNFREITTQKVSELLT